jgi:uroporphyrinogen decarboxylase
MTSRERFLAACAHTPADRRPVWLMRQAGRYLPEYRALKQKHSFVEMVRTPTLAAEVTLQPLRRFPLDAAIIFSDILIVPEAMGQPYRFKEEGGIAMEYTLDSADKIAQLDENHVAENLNYLGDALGIVRQELGGKTALLGFAGAPWTLAAYMVEGGSPAHSPAIARLAQNEPGQFEKLMRKLTRAVTECLRLQVAAGADAVQIFDSWGALCPAEHYEKWSLSWIKEIIAALPPKTPVIFFAKGMAQHATALQATGAKVLSLDQSVDLAAFRRAHPNIATQGNLEPELLAGEPDQVRTATSELLRLVTGPGHIVNLGHGITPQAKIECVAALVETVVASSLSA